MNIWFNSLVSVAIVSSISLICIFALVIREGLLQKILIFLVSFAVGGLFGDAFIHILPEIFKSGENTSMASFGVLGGILMFFVLEKFIHWRHCHSGKCLTHEQPLVWLNLFGEGLHNFIDGVIIAASYSISFPIGFATTVAVVLHEIPHEIGNFAIFVHGGWSRVKAIVINFFGSLFAILGAVCALGIGPSIQHFSHHALAVAAGGFIYLAGSDLIPELHHEENGGRSLLQFISIIFGIMIMSLMLFLE
jgi:zinc and cadmium transporter